MKIAILTSGILPVPAVLGGAVENLIDYYLEYNEQYKLHDITVFSIYHKNVNKHPALKSEVNHYEYLKVTNLWVKIQRYIYRLNHKNEYYNHYIEFFFEHCYKMLSKKEFDMVLIENRPGYALKLYQRGVLNIQLHLHNDFLNISTPHAVAILQSLSKVITVSDFIKGRVLTISQTEKVQTVYNGINMALFSKESYTPIDRTTLGLKKDDFVIVYSGRINPEKGISELIDAMIIIKEIPQIKLLIIGSPFFGETKDNDFFRSIKSKAKAIKKNIIFTGYIQYQEIPRYLNIADIAVIPSIWNEPFGLTCVEAMATGLPIITTKHGGIPEIVSEDCAIFIEDNDNSSYSEQIGKAILYLHNNPNKCHKMGLASIACSMKYCKERYAQLFFKAITR